jgi:lysophospholipase L1-like esterase
MRKRRDSDWLLVAAISVISCALFVGVYEVYQSQRYEQWKADYQASMQRHDTLTIPSPNEVLMWEYRPHGEFYDAEFNYRISTNRHGFRDREFDASDGSGDRFRVAFVGDSVTLGFKVTEENTFVRRFEEFARRVRPERKIQAMNFGVDGYQVLQIHELLRTKVLRFAPSKVVYMMCLNDFDFEDASGKKILFFKKPSSFFLDKVGQLYKRFLRQEYHRYYFEKNGAVGLRAIVGMRDVLASRAIPFQIVLLPVFEASDMGFKQYRLKDLHRRIMSVLGQHNMAVIDLAEDFAKQSATQRTYAYDVWHPNEEGHRFIALRLLKIVLGDDVDAETPTAGGSARPSASL